MSYHHVNLPLSHRCTLRNSQKGPPLDNHLDNLCITLLNSRLSNHQVARPNNLKLLRPCYRLIPLLYSRLRIRPYIHPFNRLFSHLRSRRINQMCFLLDNQLFFLLDNHQNNLCDIPLLSLFSFRRLNQLINLCAIHLLNRFELQQNSLLLYYQQLNQPTFHHGSPPLNRLWAYLPFSPL